MQRNQARKDIFHPLPDDYLDLLRKRENLILTIVGKDPYPRGRVGIPFCKPTWETMCDDTTSGFHVLRSLGLNMDAVRSRYARPRDLFLRLARDHGIAFLNLSYHYLEGDVRKRRHEEELKFACKINQPLLEKSSNVVLCGQAKRIDWHGKKAKKWVEAVHPDVRNKISRIQHVSDDWQKYWRPNALAKKFRVKATV